MLSISPLRKNKRKFVKSWWKFHRRDQNCVTICAMLLRRGILLKCYHCVGDKLLIYLLRTIWNCFCVKLYPRESRHGGGFVHLSYLWRLWEFCFYLNNFKLKLGQVQKVDNNYANCRTLLWSVSREIVHLITTLIRMSLESWTVVLP